MDKLSEEADFFLVSTKLVSISMATGLVNYFQEVGRINGIKTDIKVQNAIKYTSSMQNKDNVDLYECVKGVQTILSDNNDKRYINILDRNFENNPVYIASKFESSKNEITSECEKMKQITKEDEGCNFSNSVMCSVL